jgi:muconolactone delta-isomerase
MARIIVPGSTSPDVDHEPPTLGGTRLRILRSRDLTSRYLDGIPEGSRAATIGSALSPELLTEETMEKVRALNAIAERRGQSLAQMAIAWTLRDQRVTSALIGASSVEQLEDSLAALDRLDFSEDELAEMTGSRPMRHRLAQPGGGGATSASVERDPEARRLVAS